MFKPTVVGLDGSSFAEVAAGYVIELALRFQASLSGLQVIDVHLIEGPTLDERTIG